MEENVSAVDRTQSLFSRERKKYLKNTKESDSEANKFIEGESKAPNELKIYERVQIWNAFWGKYNITYFQEKLLNIEAEGKNSNDWTL